MESKLKPLLLQMEYLCQANRDDAVEFIGEVIASHPWYRAIRINEHRIGSMPGTGKDEWRWGGN
ncbi:unnamed protein product [Prunus brigantina]